MIPINSSAVSAIGYQAGVMAVRFHGNAKTYTMHGVPYSLFMQFLNASSHGAFWNRHLRGKFK